MTSKSESRRQSVEIAQAIFRAAADAKIRRHEAVTLEHLLHSILKAVDVQEALAALEIDHVAISETMDAFLSSGVINEIATGIPHPTREFDEVVTRAIGFGIHSSKNKAMPIDILTWMIELPEEDSFALSTLSAAGLTPLKLKRFVSHGVIETDGSGIKKVTSKEEAEKFLLRYCANLNEVAGQGGIDPLIGREEEIQTLIQITARRSKNNSILVGEPGVGKTAIAEGLAVMITAGQVPECMLDAVVYSLDIGLLMAGTRFRGDLEERLKDILKSMEYLSNGILFIDEIHNIMGAGSGSGQQGSLDVANLLKPALANGKLKCIGSTTSEEFRKHFEKDRALMRRFKRVEVKEPTPEDTKRILNGLKSRFEEFHGVEFTDEAINAAVDLTHRYVNTALLPDKAIDIIDNAGARQKVKKPEDRTLVIGVEEIEAEVAMVAKIPEQSVKIDEVTRLISLEDDLKSAVFGQDPAIKALTDAVFVSRAGLRDTNKPAGSFLFAGPTGVGKTETARQLAATLGVPLIKYDMSEYMEKHSVSKLIGSPPGYTGYGDGNIGSGKLINDIESNPYSILLLDEIEKAHPDIFNILLQVMDDAKLTSSSGKTVDFRNVMLIMTTNVGASEAARPAIGFGGSSGGDPSTALARKFSPEFRNRLDASINFSKLKPSEIISIVKKFISKMSEQALERKVIMDIDDDVFEWLSRNGYDDTMGARPLGRAIHEKIKTPLSRLMVVGPLRNGGMAKVSIVNNDVSVEAI